VSKIDLNRVWDDVRAMGAANKDLLGAISGMFVLLPTVLGGLLAKAPEAPARDAPREEVYQQMLQYYADNWPTLLGLGLIVAFAVLAMLVLLLRPERLTVGESLKAALLLLPGYVLANILQGVGFFVGFMLLILPGFYLLARLFLIAAVAAAEKSSNPLELIQRSFTLTRGNGWRIFLMLFILYFTVQVVSTVATTLVGLGALLLLPKDLAALAVSIVNGLVASAFAAFLALLAAAIYRACTGHAQGRSGASWLPGAGG